MDFDTRWAQLFATRAKRPIPEYLKGNWSQEGYEKLILFIVDTIKKEFPKPSEIKILDVGCGIGRYVFELQSQGYNVQGIDSVKELIEEAKSVYPQCKFDIASGYDLPFSEKSFDCVVSIGVLQYITDYQKLLKQMCRVAKKTIILSTLLEREETHTPIERQHKEKSATSHFYSLEYSLSEIKKICAERGFSKIIVLNYPDIEQTEGSILVISR
jgi:ubiquinone/menaquinone biosynthesis C-methylase UbiE